MDIKNASAGTANKSDILIEISPATKPGIDLTLVSSVASLFGDQIKKIILETLKELNITDAKIQATDQGALDFTIKARVTAAVCRATGKDFWE